MSAVRDNGTGLKQYYDEVDWNLKSDFAHPKIFGHEADPKGLWLN